VIKVKPKGFWFHDCYHKSIQALINWFKDNYRSKDYVKMMKRQRSPRAKVPDPLRDPVEGQVLQASSSN